MAVVLVVRPYGLLGKPEGQPPHVARQAQFLCAPQRRR